MPPKKRDMTGDDVFAQTLGEVINDINKSFKSNVASMGTEGLNGEVKYRLSTGCDLLDFALRSGIAAGRIVEIYGRPGTGKSTLVSHIMASCQKDNGLVLLIDSESTWEAERAKTLGVDMTRLIRLEADTVEEGFAHISDSIIKLRKRDELADTKILIVWDTIASIPTRNSLAVATEGGDKWAGGMMEKPKVIAEGLRRILKMIARENATLVLVNQIMSSPKGEESPGGWGIKFLSSQRIQMRTIEKLTAGDVPVGIKVLAKVVKCKITGPATKELEVTFPLYFADGLDNIQANVDYLTECKIPEIKIAVGWYKFTFPDGEQKSVRASQIKDLVLSKPGAVEWIRDLVRTNFLVKGKETAVEDPSELEVAEAITDVGVLKEAIGA